MKTQTAMFRALRHRNYRLFFYGQSISLVGTWMQQMALSWLVYRMTNSAFLLGVVAFSGQIATFFVAPLAGVFADRHNRQQLLLFTQIMSMLQASILAVLVLTNHIQIWQIILLSIVIGLINGLDLPVRQSFTADMIEDHEDLSNAIALNSSMVNAARLIGPAIGGVLIAVAGEGVCFLLNALSYICVITALLKMKITRIVRKKTNKKVWHDLKEGIEYAAGFMPIRTFLILLGLVSMIAGGVQTLMPVFARDIFHGNAKTLGLLMGGTGLGALFGALFLAGRKTIVGFERIIVTACFLFGCGMIGFAASSSLWFSLLMIVVCGFGMIVHMAATNSLLQSMVEEDKRGRVMSFYTMAFMGMSPFGSLLAGFLTHHTSANVVFVAGGFCVILGGTALLFLLPRMHRVVHPLYIEKGIIRQNIQ